MTVVVDHSGVTDVDGCCLDVFVAAHQWAVTRGGQLSLTGPRTSVAKALEDTGVDRLLAGTSQLEYGRDSEPF